jgi:hypothetical protein
MAKSPYKKLDWKDIRDSFIVALVVNIPVLTATFLATYAYDTSIKAALSFSAITYIMTVFGKYFQNSQGKFFKNEPS